MCSFLQSHRSLSIVYSARLPHQSLRWVITRLQRHVHYHYSSVPTNMEQRNHHVLTYAFNGIWYFNQIILRCWIFDFFYHVALLIRQGAPPICFDWLIWLCYLARGQSWLNTWKWHCTLLPEPQSLRTTWRLHRPLNGKSIEKTESAHRDMWPYQT